jgi:hypothetical protein
VEKCFDPQRGALVLEVLAEAARNPKVAAIVRAADQQERALARTMIGRSHKPEWSDAEFEARCETVGLIFDGLVMRAVNHPDLDRVALTRVRRTTMRHLLG